MGTGRKAAALVVKCKETKVNINTVDLNLFLVFQAIYVTRSVTLAGERIGMTQSAASNALKRMRERFSDPLFVRTTEGMVPTPLAERLIGTVDAGLGKFAQAIDQGRQFDPITSDRIFRVAINDIGQLVIMPRLLAAAQRHAPHVRFETVDAGVAEAKQGMLHGQIDLAVGSWKAMGQAFFQQRLFDETFVILMSSANALASHELSFDDYSRARHIAYRPSGATDTELQNTLNRAGVMSQRNVVLTAAHSLGLSAIVASSDLLLTAPSRLAQTMAATRADLKISATPFEMAPFAIRQQWHERFQLDCGNRWLRTLIFSLFHQPSAGQVVAMAMDRTPPMDELEVEDEYPSR
jgi:DNA-binding transcriptional LysR family regulator